MGPSPRSADQVETLHCAGISPENVRGSLERNPYKRNEQITHTVLLDVANGIIVRWLGLLTGS